MPYFVLMKGLPVLYIPKQIYYADIVSKPSTLPMLWDREEDSITVTNNFLKANVSSFLKLTQLSKLEYALTCKAKT